MSEVSFELSTERVTSAGGFFLQSDAEQEFVPEADAEDIPGAAARGDQVSYDPENGIRSD